MKTTFSYFSGMFENPATAKYYLKKQNQIFTMVPWKALSCLVYAYDLKKTNYFQLWFLYKKKEVKRGRSRREETGVNK